MSRAYHEDKAHGTSVFPLQVYSHHDKDGFYFVSQHWHEELECVYAEYGILNLTIHGKPLVLNLNLTHKFMWISYCFYAILKKKR